jgi:dolichol-phosphate mannosyltransferase
MQKLPVLHIVIPVLNEGENVPVLLDSLRQVAESVGQEFDCHIIIVDDGSTDSTRDSIERCRGNLSVVVLSHDVNCGPGAAFNSGFRYLKGRLGEADWVVTMEGDNTSRIDTLMHMLRRRHEGYDVVLASAYAYGGGIEGVETTRVVLSHLANFLAKLLLGLRGFQTLSSFFRLYSSGILRRLQERFGPGIVEFQGFECMVELLLKLVLVKAKISEVEMRLGWSKREGKSKMRIFRTMLGYAKLLYTGWCWRKKAGEAFWVPVKRI